MTTLLLLPGMDGTGEFFDDFVAALGGECQTVIVRYPTDRPLDYAQLEPIARAAIPAAGPFVILGESFSGPIAIRLAATAPARLQGLVLCASFARRPGPRLPGLHVLAGRVPPSWAAALLGPMLLGRFATPALRARLSQSVSAVSPAVWRARLRAVMAVDVTAQLQNVNVPILYLRATGDRLVPDEASRWVTRHQPGTDVVDFDAPHFLLQAAPVPTAQAVLGFLRRTAPSS